ncbi:G-protein coupled receptor family C group 6 member A-like, partial [Clarias magur]
LLNELKQVTFTLDNQTFYFNASGDFVNGYDLMNWAQNKSDGHRHLKVVGGYNLEQEQINIDEAIQWYNSNSNK